MSSFGLSRAETVALIGAVAVLAIAAQPALGPLLEYRRAQLFAEPWRLLCAHLVHVDQRHAFVNASAWVLLARLFAGELDARRQLLALAAGALAIDAGLAAFWPQIAWYRGLSGAVHTLWLAGLVTQFADALRHRRRARVALSLALVVGTAAKLALEHPLAAGPVASAWLGLPTVPQAHLLGALAGAALGAGWALRPQPSRTDVSRAGG